MTTTMTKRKLIAFTGYAGAGKDEAAAPLIAAGWERRAFGDIIKSVFDPLVRKHLGFSAHTQDRGQKSCIRGLLVHGGEAFYEAIFHQYFHPNFGSAAFAPLVNSRLMRLREAVKWKEFGGIIIEVVRPGVEPAEPMEAAWLEEIRAAGHIDHRIHNGGTVQALHQSVSAIAGIPMTPVAPATVAEQDAADWAVFAERFEKQEGFAPHPRDSRHKRLFDYFQAGAAAQDIGRRDKGNPDMPMAA